MSGIDGVFGEAPYGLSFLSNGIMWLLCGHRPRTPDTDNKSEICICMTYFKLC